MYYRVRYFERLLDILIGYIRLWKADHYTSWQKGETGAKVVSRLMV